jgi:hypothetical protein
LIFIYKEHYSARELERQINSSYFERYMLSTKKISPIIYEFNQKTDNVFLDTYVAVPQAHSRTQNFKLLIHFTRYIEPIGT